MRSSTPAPTTSAVAAGFVELVPDLPMETLRHIERLLLANLASPTGAELREARLGLLIDMVAGGSGEIPLTADYDAAVERRRAFGESWPDSTTLSRAYCKSWTTAVRAAMRLVLCDGPRRVPHSYKHAVGGQNGYGRSEVVAALMRFHHDHEGRWPQPSQFYDWGQQLRLHARTNGHRDPRIPTRKALGRHFDSFDLARRAAQLASSASA